MADIITVAVALATVVGTLVAVLGYRAGQRREKRETQQQREKARQEEIAAQIKTALDPLVGQVKSLGDQVERIAETQRDTVRRVQDLDHITLDMKAKVEVFWAAAAKHAADILHSPHPERHHIDRLLEKFKDLVDGNGRMTPAEIAQLREELEYIVNLSHNETSRIPLFEGDKVSAAIILATLDMMEGVPK